MTGSLPQQVRDAFESFITCEYTTVDGAGQPITWPVTPYYDQGAPTIDLTTGLGYPKKADDAARNPRVALLFSDPTGSGISSPSQVLVQGIAEVDDRDLTANRERYWRESNAKLPATRDLHPPRLVRGLFGWYYTRIYVHIRPERVFVWPGGDATSEPAIHDSHIEEVRSGQSQEPPAPRAPAPPAPPTWDRRIEELGERYREAVISWLAPDGFPLSARLPVSLESARRRVLIEAEPGGLPLAEGRACLTAHRHAPDFAWQENFQVRGNLTRTDDGWALVPTKLVGGFELPDEGTLAGYRRNAGKILRFRRIARARLKGRP